MVNHEVMTVPWVPRYLPKILTAKAHKEYSKKNTG